MVTSSIGIEEERLLNFLHVKVSNFWNDIGGTKNATDIIGIKIIGIAKVIRNEGLFDYKQLPINYYQTGNGTGSKYFKVFRT